MDKVCTLWKHFRPENQFWDILANFVDN